MQLRHTAVALLLLLACDGNTTSTVVEGTPRQVTITRATTTSQSCDATHDVSCSTSACCASPERCVVAVRPATGGAQAFFCAVCPADFPTACSQTSCCKSDSACIVNGTLATIGTCRCGAGETVCGDNCCPGGSSCVAGECRSCPSSAPHLCGTECQSTPCDDEVTPDGTCSPPTGCGNGWLNSCDNRCYSTSSDCQAAGPPQGCNSGSCRQCP